MAEAIGHRVWAIAEGYIPPSSTGNTRQLVSHEAVCILNAGDTDADVEITVYFAEREPAGPYSDQGARAAHASRPLQRS